jgi:hypothetical protein
VLTTAEVTVVDLGCGSLACLSLWARRRWPLGVALVCAVLGAFSISATPAGLLALFSLAVNRSARPALLVTTLWIPALLFALYSPTTNDGARGPSRHDHRSPNNPNPACPG